MSICKFCEQEKALIASHIIPNVLYQLEKYGVVALNNAVVASQYAHCRIGLARKFLMQENHCYLMLNGLFLY